MPASPKKGETEKEFIGRCIPFLVKEGKPQDQAAAICYSMWEKKDEMKLINKIDMFLNEAANPRLETLKKQLEALVKQKDAVKDDKDKLLALGVKIAKLKQNIEKIKGEE